MKRVCLLATTVATVVGLSVLSANAAVIRHDNNLPLGGWAPATAIPPMPFNTEVDGYPLTSVHGSAVPVGNMSQTIGVQLTGTETGTGIRDDLVYSSGNFAGVAYNLSSQPTEAGVYGIEFDWYTGETSYNPATLSLFINDGSFTWYYDLTLPAANGWTHYVSIISPGAYGSWYSPDGGVNFGAALGNIADVGVRILYQPSTDGPMNFGIGNFEYHDSDSYYIPEPGTYMMLSTALMSLGYTFARRRREQKKVA